MSEFIEFERYKIRKTSIYAVSVIVDCEEKQSYTVFISYGIGNWVRSKETTRELAIKLCKSIAGKLNDVIKLKQNSGLYCYIKKCKIDNVTLYGIGRNDRFSVYIVAGCESFEFCHDKLSDAEEQRKEILNQIDC